MVEVEALYRKALGDLRALAPALADAVEPMSPVFEAGGTVRFGTGTILVNRQWFAGLDDAERASCLATIGFHQISDKITPLGERDPMIWNLACSAVTNANLAAMGFRLPAGALVEPTWRNRTVDEAYARLADMGDILRRGQAGTA